MKKIQPSKINTVLTQEVVKAVKIKTGIKAGNGIGSYTKRFSDRRLKRRIRTIR
jgi:hypothetical protein